MDIILALVPIKMALREVYAADLNEKDASEARRRLNEVYDAFVAKRGPINLEVRSIRRPSIVEQEAARQEAFETARATGEEFDVGSFDAGPMLADGRSLGEIARAREEARAQPDYREGDFDPEAMPDKIVVKRPNIEPFGDDPESFRLRAIERYDSETDTAKKTRVFTESAITKSVAPKIASPEDALLFTLSDTGRVDLDRIAAMAKSTPELVRDELGDKIFLDPASGDWKTRANYLSGNVRRKLRQAQDAAKLNPAYDINVQALEAILPQPVVSSEIRVPIGASWFPASLYSDWAKSLGLRLSADHKETLGLWVVDGSTTEAKAKNEYGTEALPFGDLMRRVMNGKSLKVQYTVKDADGSTRTVVDDEATQAATDKAEELRRLFNEWFWSDEARASEMEGVYNEVFNAEVAPKYDGGYLTTPGIHADWSWRPHQTSVVSRILQSGSTYMAHTVGAGKTSAMIGAVMEARRLGIWKKPMIVVPNHMLAQFATEFYQQYPLANILVADEKRFHTATRKQFIADVALGDWDAVIITHSGFGKIPASDRAKSAAVEDMLGDIREVLDGTSGRDDKASGRGGDMATERSILGALESIASTLGVDTSGIKEKGTSTRKKIEQLLEAAEQRIARQTSDVGKDQVFDFDELGVDAMLVDEAHLFRKLSFATGKGAIKGIDPAGSIASMDLYVKARALDKLNPGRSLVLASGTPITNTMAEAYTISRYLQPDALQERGVSAFDSWAGTFGEIVSALEQTPDGGYKEVSRFAKFVNTPELSLMMRQVMDVVTGADLEKYVTRPKLKGGKRNLVVVEATSELKAYQGALGERMTAIQNRKGPVKKGDDIMLSVINDGRLAAIDMRLVDPSSRGHGSKLERMIANAFRVWKEGAETPLHGVKKEGGYTDEPVMRGPSTQIIFATLGINGSKHNQDFKIHRFIKSELVRMGVPPGDIILAETLTTHAQKARAFGDMNEGSRRILIGSKSLFTGVNAQRRLAAIHNLDPLWYPADDEQRNGRGIRQGNMNPEIEIFDYSTKGTYDATMWGMMGRKAAFIEGFFRGDPDMREMEDLGEASVFEQAKAMSTSDPRILELTDLKSERDKLDRRRSAAKSQRDRLAFEIRSTERQEQRLRDELVEMQQLSARAKDLSGDRFVATIDGVEYTERKLAGNALIAFAADIVETSEQAVSGRKVGEISSFPVEISTSMADKSAEFSIRVSPDWNERVGWSDDPVGLMRRLEGVVAGVRLSAERTEGAIAATIRKRGELKASEANLKGFADQEKLDAINDRIDAIEAELIADASPEKATKKGDESESRIPQDTPPGWGEVEADPPITDADIAAITRDLNAELARTGLAGKAKVVVIRDLVNSSGIGVQGVAAGSRIGINARSPYGPLGVMRHEIIHVLRNAALWGKDYGLFTAEEWRGLVRESRKDRATMARIARDYSDRSEAVRTEEAVAELYRLWAARRDQTGAVAVALRKIMGFLEAVANALRGGGFQSAARTMEKIARGDVGGRGPDTPNNPRDSKGRYVGTWAESVSTAELRMPSVPYATTKDEFDAKERSVVSKLLTDAMGGKSGRYNLLALVPGRALFSELGKAIPAAQRYLRFKEEMDAMRGEWHHKTDQVSQEWHSLIAKDGRANKALMDLMHDATRAGVDPSRAFKAPERRKGVLLEEHAEKVRKLKESYSELRPRFQALPAEFQAMFGKVRDTYDQLATAFEDAVINNASKAMRIGVERAERAYSDEIQRIKDEGLRGEEKAAAEAAAAKKLTAARRVQGWGRNARLSQLRMQFESNRLDGPYFPLMRFGNYFVTARDSAGKVVSFSRFESEKKQAAFAAEMRKQGVDVTTGVLADTESLKDQVDPNFVADIEAIIGEEMGDPAVMDMVWQRWLETLPDFSVRRSRIHRKGTPGWDGDAFRAFGRQVFHGGHQLARLTYALDMQKALEDARREAAETSDPNRNGLIVNEMEKRHAYVMNPTGSAAAQALTSAAFIYYLGITPAAALVNVSQTTVVGIPMLSAGFDKGGVTRAAAALTGAMRDFVAGRGHAGKSNRLTAEERAAMEEAYRRGTIDKSEAHDLAGVAESGVEYSSVRMRVMKPISFLFHHAERLNREVTFLAAYRMGRDNGFGHGDAINKAADLTWKAHFDYQNCVDGQTEILTVEGWKRWDQVKAGDRIFSTDDAGKAVEIEVQEVNVFHREQEIALFEAQGGRRFSMAVTDDHKCVAMKESKASGRRGFTLPHFIEAKDLDQRHHILRAPLAPLDRPDTIGTDMAALIGWFAAEGWYARNRGAEAKNNVRLEQSAAKNPEYVAEIDGILERLGGGFSRQIVKGGRHVLWSLSGVLVATLSATEMAALLDAFAKGDGSRHGRNNCITIEQKASTNLQNLEVLQAMATLLGKTASLGFGKTRDSAHLTMPGNGLIQTTKTAVAHLERKRLAVPMVWCPTTDNGRWIARRNGCVFVTGNTSRPRVMQSDTAKVLLVFRNFQISMLWRLFRDAHQVFNGRTAAEKKEARAQLLGITAMMMLHAGITGTWGYALLMMLTGLFLDGGSDEAEEELKRAVVETFGPGAGGMLLKGVPGHVLGLDLTNRLGMPELWFRSSDRTLEGEDQYNYWLQQMVGAVPGIFENQWRGIQQIGEGETWRGVETMSPKFVRDLMKAARYAEEGVTTYSGEPLLDNLNAAQIVVQALGFTPANVSERYETNTRLKNRERRITRERQSILADVTSAMRDGEVVAPDLVDEVRAFNAANPDYPITPDTIMRSLRSRMRASREMEGGVRLNQRLDQRLREEAAPSIY
jgi:N12 class adenine-specific DNA methylase